MLDCMAEVLRGLTGIYCCYSGELIPASLIERVASPRLSEAERRELGRWAMEPPDPRRIACHNLLMAPNGWIRGQQGGFYCPCKGHLTLKVRANGGPGSHTGIRCRSGPSLRKRSRDYLLA